MRIFLYNFPCRFVGRTPGRMTVVVSRTFLQRIVKRFVPTLGPDIHTIRWHKVKTTCLERRNRFCDYKRSFGKTFGNVGKFVFVIIKSNQIERFGLEKRVNVARFVTTGCDGACKVERLYNFHQATCKQCIETYFSIFIIIRINIALLIKQHIGLLQVYGIAVLLNPLFLHFIANAPHDYRRMIAIAYHKISEIALVPVCKIE